MPIQTYRDLEAWQLGMDFVVQVYALTKRFPRDELYGLSSQLRRAAVAVPSNVSEGHQRGTKAYEHFVSIAIGSLAEAETQIEIARRIGYVAGSDVDALANLAGSLRRVLHGLRRSLKRKNEGKGDQ